MTVVQNERTFSKLKTVETALRNSMTDNRLHNLILLNCEKDITDRVDLDYLLIYELLTAKPVMVIALYLTH